MAPTSFPHRPPLYFMPSHGFNGPGVLVLFVQVLLFLASSQTGGVTHWKLTEDTIGPAPAVGLDLAGISPGRSGSKSEDMYAGNQLAANDPEFAILMRYSSRDSTVPLNRGGKSPRILGRAKEESSEGYCEEEKEEEEECSEESFSM